MFRLSKCKIATHMKMLKNKTNQKMFKKMKMMINNKVLLTLKLIQNYIKNKMQTLKLTKIK